MTPVQENLLKLLKEIDEICRKHDITYYLAGGTALGAVRNNGFLPWDDDMDLYITRENWKKLEKVIDGEMREDRGLASTDRNDLYQNPILRYVDKNTTTIYRSQALAGAACGQHVEFMVMDPVPRDPEKYKEFRKLLLVYTELLTTYFVVNRQVVNADSDFDYDTYKYYREMMDKKGRKKVLEMLEEKIFSYSDSDEECDYYCLRWGLRILMYGRKNYGKPRYEDFEGFKAPVGCCAEGIFREAYGNTWMMIPEAQEQETHDSLHSLTLSYQNYISDYLKFMNREEALANYRDYKDFRMGLLIDNEKTTVKRHKLFAVKHKLHIEKTLSERNIDLKKLLKEKRYKELGICLKEYLNRQLSGDFNKWQIFIDVNDDIIYSAVIYLIVSGKYHQGLKIIKLCRMNERMTEELEKAEALANAVRDISVEIYDNKDLAEAQRIKDEWFEKYPDVIDFVRCDLQTDIFFAESREDYSKCLEKAERYNEKYPDDGELLKLKGDCLLELGKEEEGIITYLKAREHTRNGIVLNFMRKKLILLGVDSKIIESAPLL